MTDQRYTDQRYIADRSAAEENTHSDLADDTGPDEAEFADELEFQVEQQREHDAEPQLIEPSIAEGIAAAADDGASSTGEEKISTIRAQRNRASAFSSRNSGFFIGFFAVAAVGVLAMMLYVIPSSLSDHGSVKIEQEADTGDSATSVRIAIEPRPASIAGTRQAQGTDGVQEPKVRTVAVKAVHEPAGKLDPSFYQPAPKPNPLASGATTDERTRILSELRSEPALVPAPAALTGARVPADENASAAVAKLDDINSAPRNPVRRVETLVNRAGAGAPVAADDAPGQSSQIAAAPAAITQPARGLVGQPQPRPAEPAAAAVAPSKPSTKTGKPRAQWIERAFGFGHGR